MTDQYEQGARLYSKYAERERLRQELLGRESPHDTASLDIQAIRDEIRREQMSGVILTRAGRRYAWLTRTRPFCWVPARVWLKVTRWLG